MSNDISDYPPKIGDEFECTLEPDSSTPKGISSWRPGDKLTVIAHVRMQGLRNAVFWNERDMTASTLRDDLYRPIRTPEQVEENEREARVEALREIIKRVERAGGDPAIAIEASGYRITTAQ